MNISDRCIAMICHHEGIRYKAYKCPAKLWTIGVGHLLYNEQAKLPLDQRDSFALKEEDNRTFSKEEVDGLLKNDLRRFESGVAKLCPVALTQGQYDSIISFSFNCGLGTLQRSTFRQKINRQDFEGAAEELLKYVIGGGKILPGLVKRRKDERALFLSTQ